ncbi:hypothetical protein JCGZ_06007 [Jatropha curcas]|uniref:Uncharacterized protein n=1 Tax=Jatropha curcas TaxID=180498 RepID=A0A067J9P2_JATCU|nr:hypothetical protein JCGZ_06007 [Jatropha curcas]
MKVNGGGSSHERTVDRSRCSRKDLSTSMAGGTRKMLNYAWIGRSQKKFWWRLVVVLTCKSMTKSAYGGERPIEASSSWFLSKFPSGKQYGTQFYEVKRMIRGLGGETPFTYSQTLNM